MATQDGKPGGLARSVPTIGWLPRYERRRLRGDVTAGIAVTVSTGPSSSLAAVAGGAVLVTGLGEQPAAGLVGAEHTHGNVHRALEAELATERARAPS